MTPMMVRGAMLDIDDGAEHRRLSAEVALPVAIADERDIPVAGLDIDIGGGAAKDGLDAEDGRSICADVVAAETLRRASFHQGDVIWSRSGDAGEDVRCGALSRAYCAGGVDAP